MEYNVLSRVETYAPQGETLEQYFHVEAVKLSDEILASSSKVLPKIREDTIDDLQRDAQPSGDRGSRNDPSEASPTSPPKPTKRSADITFPPELPIRQYKNLPSCALINFLKGFGLGSAGRAGVGLLAALTSLAKTPSKKVVGGPFAHVYRSLSQLKKEPLQFGLALGTMFCVHNSIIYREDSKASRCKHYNSARAAYYAAFGLIFAPREFRQTVSLMAIVRAIEIAVRQAAQKKQIPTIPHSVELAFAAISARISYVWIFAPYLFERSYLSFINRTSGKPVAFLRGAEAVTKRSMTPELVERVNNARMKLKMPPMRFPSSSILSQGVSAAYSMEDVLFKPRQSTVNHFITYTWEQINRIKWIYMPVHALPLALFRINYLLSNPLKALIETSKNVVRSTVFLASWCSIGWLGFGTIIPLIQKAAPRSPPSMPPRSPPHWAVLLGSHCAGAMCALSIFFEKPSRRIELVLYSGMQVLRTFLSQIVGGRRERGVLCNSVQVGEIVLFASSMSVIMHACARHPSTIRSTYYRLLMRFFDPDRTHQAIVANQKKKTAEKVPKEEMTREQGNAKVAEC